MVRRESLTTTTTTDVFVCEGKRKRITQEYCIFGLHNKLFLKQQYKRYAFFERVAQNSIVEKSVRTRCPSFSLGTSCHGRARFRNCIGHVKFPTLEVNCSSNTSRRFFYPSPAVPPPNARTRHHLTTNLVRRRHGVECRRTSANLSRRFYGVVFQRDHGEFRQSKIANPLLLIPECDRAKARCIFLRC